MCGKIDCYLKLFANLRTDRNRKRWTDETAFRAPHKPFLLLSILDLIAQRVITSEFVEPSFELAETFTQYWQRVLPLTPTGKMAYPFFHMSGEPFWKLVPRPGVQQPGGRVISSMKKIREIYLGAKLDKELMPLLLMEPLRERLRVTLVATYFAPEVQPALLEQGLVNYGAYQYSKSLLQKTETAEIPLTLETENQKKQIRDQGFRKAIVALYEHRCSLCGIRMLTPDGHTAVEAAHIVPWSESNNDRPTNGMALCKLCHWSFDEGLMSVGKNYEVLVSSQVKREPNFPGHMLTLSDRPIFRPAELIFWPDQANIEWHRKKTFRR